MRLPHRPLAAALVALIIVNYASPVIGAHLSHSGQILYSASGQYDSDHRRLKPTS